MKQLNYLSNNNNNINQNTTKKRRWAEKIKEEIPRFKFAMQSEESFNTMYNRSLEQEFIDKIKKEAVVHHESVLRFLNHEINENNQIHTQAKEKYSSKISSALLKIESLCQLYNSMLDLKHFTYRHYYKLYQKIEASVAQYHSLRDRVFSDLIGSFDFLSLPDEIAIKAMDYFLIDDIKKLSSVSHKSNALAVDDLLWKNKIFSFFDTFKENDVFKLMMEGHIKHNKPYKSIFYALLAYFTNVDPVLAQLIIALQDKKLDDVKKIVKEENFVVTNQGKLTYSLITWAIILDREEILPELVSGISDNVLKTSFGEDIKFAIKNSHDAVITKIFKSKNSPDINENLVSLSTTNLSPILFAARQLKVKCVNALIANGAILTSTTAAGSHIFHAAAGSSLKHAHKIEAFQEIEKIYEEAAKKNASMPTLDKFLKQQNIDHKTPLHYAAIKGNLELMQYLIDEKRLDAFALDKKGHHPFKLFMVNLKDTTDSAVIQRCINYFFSLNPTAAQIGDLVEYFDNWDLNKRIPPKILEMQQAVLEGERSRNLPSFGTRKLKHKFPQTFINLLNLTTPERPGYKKMSKAYLLLLAAVIAICFSAIILMTAGAIPVSIPIIMLSVKGLFAVAALCIATHIIINAAEKIFQNIPTKAYEQTKNVVKTIGNFFKSVYENVKSFSNKVSQRTGYQRVATDNKNDVESQDISNKQPKNSDTSDILGKLKSVDINSSVVSNPEDATAREPQYGFDLLSKTANQNLTTNVTSHNNNNNNDNVTLDTLEF